MHFTKDELMAKPWTQHEFDDVASTITSMINYHERQLISWLGSNYFTGKGYIVDLGPFYGSETVTFASSLPQNILTFFNSIHLNEKPIQAYDLFIDNDGMSFFHNYSDNISLYSGLIETHCGDLNEVEWSSERFIEILFNDISKSVETNATVLNKFMSSIDIGSVLIQQDYYDDHFWIPITMEILEEYFIQLDGPIGGTAFYLCTKKIPYNKLTYAANPSFEDSLSAIRKVQRRYQGWYKRLFQLSEAKMLTYFGKLDEALEIIERVSNEYPNHKVLARRIDRIYKFAMRKKNNT
jgi:hypothetical protein